MYGFPTTPEDEALYTALNARSAAIAAKRLDDAVASWDALRASRKCEHSARIAAYVAACADPDQPQPLDFS